MQFWNQVEFSYDLLYISSMEKLILSRLSWMHKGQERIFSSYITKESFFFFLLGDIHLEKIKQDFL